MDIPRDLFSAEYPPSPRRQKSEERLSDRQRWDRRYTTFKSDERIKPIPFLVACLPRLPTQGYALDVAAGAGRNSVALATHGLTVDAVDVSWQGLRRAIGLARQQGVRVNPVVLDLSRGWLPRRRYDVVVNTFFLLRDLIPNIKAALKPGGWLVFETLTIAQTEITPRRGRDQKYLLRPGELRQLFDDFVVLDYWEGIEESRATARLLARKPGQPECR